MQFLRTFDENQFLNSIKAKLGFFFNPAFLRQSITIFNLKQRLSHQKKKEFKQLNTRMLS